MVINLRDYRASKSWLLMAVALCLVILTGSFFLDGAAVRLKNGIQTPGLTTAMKTMTLLGNLSVLVLVVACVYATGRAFARDHVRRTAIFAALALLTTGLCLWRRRKAEGNRVQWFFKLETLPPPRAVDRVGKHKLSCRRWTSCDYCPTKARIWPITTRSCRAKAWRQRPKID